MSLPIAARQQPLPPDVNAMDNHLITSERWYSRLALQWPLIYIFHALLAIPLLVLSIYFAVGRHDPVKHPEPFWSLFPEFLAILVTIIVTLFMQFVILPSVWKDLARKLIAAGGFEANLRQGGRRLVLEMGCNEGTTSAIFARAIIATQRDISNLSGPTASLPTFIGYDKWSLWSRIPNKPKNYLTTLLHAGVPRECIIANRVDNTSKETRTRLPYADNSISFVISNLGLSEIARFRSGEEQEALFREVIRVLEPEGQMIIVEREAIKLSMGFKGLWGGPMVPYKRLLVDEMGWPKENTKTKWHWGIQYLIGVKPVGVKQIV
jgi:SAM-dependent methyltransferase